MFQSTVNIIFDRVGRVDPVTRGIEIAVNYLGIQFDVSTHFGDEIEIIIICGALISVHFDGRAKQQKQVLTQMIRLLIDIVSRNV